METYIVTVAFRGINKNKGDEGIVLYKILGDNLDDAQRKVYARLSDLNQKEEGEYINTMQGLSHINNVEEL